MAVTRVNSATADGTSVTIPAHQAGDLLLFWAFRDGSNGTPTAPGDITPLESNTSNSAGSICGYKIAASSSETSGTWSNATEVAVVVYRGVDPTNPIGDTAVATNIGTTVSFPALSMIVTDGTSWVAGLTFHRSTNTNLNFGPSGMSNFLNAQNGGDEVAGHDTNGGVSSWSQGDTSVGGSSSGWVAYTVEIRADSGGGTETADVDPVVANFVVPDVTATYLGPPPAVKVDFVIPAVTAVAQGVLIYVATTGNDTTGDGSQGNPYLTVQKGLDEAMPGDTVIVRSGTYTQNLHTVRAGLSSAPITLRPYSGETVTLQFTESGAGTGIYGIYVNHDYFQVQQFDGTLVLDDGHDTINIEDADFGLYEGFEILDSFTEGIRLRGSSSNNVFDGLLIHNTGNGGGNGEGIYIGTGGGSDNCNFNEVRNCEIHTAIDGGIDIKENCHDNLIEDNEVYNTTGGGSGQIDDRGFDNIIRRNNVHDSIDGAGIYPGDGTQVYRNRSYGNAGNGIKISVSASPLIYNNTVYGNGDSGIETTSTAGTAIDVRNNIVFDNTGAEIYEAAVGQIATFNYNYLHKSDGGDLYREGDGTTHTTNASLVSGTGFNTNGSDADPELTDPVNDDFTAQSGSPVIDAGMVISPYTDGYLGAAPDIGWDEQAASDVAEVSPVVALFTILAVTAIFQATAATAAVTSVFTVPAVTATHHATASVSPVIAAISLPAVSAQHQATAAVEPVVAELSIPSVTPSAGQAASVVPIQASFQVPAVSAAHQNTALVAPVNANLTTPAVAAQSTVTASVLPINALLSSPAVTATHHSAADIAPVIASLFVPTISAQGGGTAGVMPAAAVFTIPTPAATHRSRASVSPVSIAFSLPQVLATHRSTATVQPLGSVFVLPAVAAQFGATADVAAVSAQFLMPTVEATHQNTAEVQPVEVEFAVQAVIATHHSRAAAQPVMASLVVLPVNARHTQRAALAAISSAFFVSQVNATHHSRATVEAVRAMFVINAVTAEFVAGLPWTLDDRVELYTDNRRIPLAVDDQRVVLTNNNERVRLQNSDQRLELL